MRYIKVIKRILLKIIEMIFQTNWYPNKKVILESVPDMACQTYPIFKEMLSQEWNKQYKLIWFVTDKKKFKNLKYNNVYFQDISPKNVFEKILQIYTQMTCRAFLYANRYPRRYFKKQLQVYLKHGTCIKSRLKHCQENDINESDLCISISDFFTNIDVDELHIRRESIFATGYPRNDFLFQHKKGYFHKIYPNEIFHKIIIWMPTFRQLTGGKRIDSSYNFPLGVPCIYNEMEIRKINDELKKQKMLLILKPHPGQDLTTLKSIDLSNFKILIDSVLQHHHVHLYELLVETDALITDYSSIYYDYLLTGKMIGLTTDDYEYYKQETGFVFDNIYDILIGEHISNSDEFVRFIKLVAWAKDELKDSRHKICGKIHRYQDNRSSKRVLSLIQLMLQQRYH